MGRVMLQRYVGATSVASSRPAMRPTWWPAGATTTARPGHRGDSACDACCGDHEAEVGVEDCVSLPRRAFAGERSFVRPQVGFDDARIGGDLSPASSHEVAGKDFGVATPSFAVANPGRRSGKGHPQVQIPARALGNSQQGVSTRSPRLTMDVGQGRARAVLQQPFGHRSGDGDQRMITGAWNCRARANRRFRTLSADGPWRSKRAGLGRGERHAVGSSASTRSADCVGDPRGSPAPGRVGQHTVATLRRCVEVKGVSSTCLGWRPQSRKIVVTLRRRAMTGPQAKSRTFFFGKGYATALCVAPGRRFTSLRRLRRVLPLTVVAASYGTRAKEQSAVGYKLLHASCLDVDTHLQVPIPLAAGDRIGRFRRLDRSASAERRAFCSTTSAYCGEEVSPLGLRPSSRRREWASDSLPGGGAELIREGSSRYPRGEGGVIVHLVEHYQQHGHQRSYRARVRDPRQSAASNEALAEGSGCSRSMIRCSSAAIAGPRRGAREDATPRRRCLAVRCDPVLRRGIGRRDQVECAIPHPG